MPIGTQSGGGRMIENWRQLAKAKISIGISVSIWQTIEPEHKPFSVELVATNPHGLAVKLPWSTTTPCDDLLHAATNYVVMIDHLANKDPNNVTDWNVFDALANRQILAAIESKNIQSLKNRLINEVA